MAQFQFVMRSGPTVGRTFPLEVPELTIGRDVSNQIPINDAEVSRKHVRLTLKNNGYVVEDLGSTNGTFVNGQRISNPTVLKMGDLVAFGENVVLMYEANFDPNATVLSSKTTQDNLQTMIASAPVPTPVPAAAPAKSAPAPAPAYVGQVPASPIQEPTQPKKKSKVIWIVVLVLVLLCICAVSVLLYFAPRTFWCSIPFIQWPAGQCP
jgi:pSer/pThr/pTyr-binding forkhead associated (FHA) protein